MTLRTFTNWLDVKLPIELLWISFGLEALVAKTASYYQILFSHPQFYIPNILTIGHPHNSDEQRGYYIKCGSYLM